MSKKRIYSLDDLYKLILNNKTNYNFNSNESGYQLSVQIPAQFEVMKENKDDSLLFCKVKLMHSGENRNHSNVTDDALKKAAKTLAYKPILAGFMEYTDEKTGETLKDFTSHDAELNDDGSINYIEKQIGCFTSDEPFFKVEEETGHNFLYGYCAIPREYTDATSIIERKGGTKVSVELAINEMSYDTSSHVLNLNDVIILGATCLGKDPDTLKNVEEGMLNARLDIADFNLENNSVFSNYETKMMELQERLEKLESACLKNNFEKGGAIENNMNKFEELLSKYNKTIEDITFEYESLTDEELEAKFEEMFGEGDPESEPEGTTVEPENPDRGAEPETEPIVENSVVEPETPIPETESFTKTFALSHEDLRGSLYRLLEPLEQAENDCYWIVSTYDDYFIYQSYMGNYYKQKYSIEGEAVSFIEGREQVFAEFVTEAELAELDSIRANYSSIQEKLAKYEKAEDIANKMTVFEDEAYGKYLDTDEFKSLMSEDVLTKFSKEELIEKADAALGKLVKTTKTFAMNNTSVQPQVKPIGLSFAKHEEESSFLDGLLNLNK